MLYTFHINMIAQMLISLLITLLVIRFDSHVDKEISEYLKWAIPYQLIILYADGLGLATSVVMKCFNYVWSVIVWHILNDLLMCAVALYLAILRKMYFKGAVLATLVYMVSMISYAIPWWLCIFNIKKDIIKVNFEAENEDETEESQWIEKKQDQKLTLN